MKKNIIYYTIFILLLASCGGRETDGHGDDHVHNHGHEGDDHGEEIHFTQDQFNALGVKVDSLPKRNLGTYVEANGELEVPPQNQAEVTAVIGANVKNIKVIEGEKVKKGQVLAYLAHPDLIQLQTDYITNWNDLQFLEQEYERQSKLYEDKITSGKDFQKLKSDYNSKVGVVTGSKRGQFASFPAGNGLRLRHCANAPRNQVGFRSHPGRSGHGIAKGLKIRHF